MLEVHKDAIDSYITDRVREKRLNLKLSQEKLSERLGLSNKFVAHVENPKRRSKYNIYHIIKLAEIFECSPCDLIPTTSLSDYLIP
ncbi:MAG: helix-turn-helix transcriptional regulator [Sphingobacteriaceae bacterium]|nr:helix-turn-helix transcriptional regulator [Sphingobacteriaceae bacterium]